MLQLAARYADAWNAAWPVEPTALKESYDEFKKACAIVGRDATAVELTVGTAVKLLSAGEEAEEAKAISGSPQAIARCLESFAREGATHVIVLLEPLTLESIEQFGHIAELVRRHE